MARFNPKGKMNKSEAAHIAHIKQLPCIRCGQMGVDSHHLVECGRRLGHPYSLPVCKFHHQMIYELSFAEQMDACREMYKKEGWEWVEPVTKIVRRNVISD